MLCGCKTTNVIQPSPVKTINRSLGDQVEAAAAKHFKGELILSDIDVDQLPRPSFVDINNNNNVKLSQADQLRSNRSEHASLKNYDLQTVIGEGSFSKVYKAQNKQTRDYFALKIIDKAKSLQSDLPSYDREPAILSKTNHPNVITLYEVFYSSAKVYLVLELATGGDLFDRISSNGSYSEPLARSTLKMVTNGLSYLHRLGITHRDLKLENLLYKTPEIDSNIFISDFGLSHIASKDRTGMSTTCGSAEYLAPEVLEGAEYSKAIDTWALGVIAYVVLSAHMPFMDQSRARLHQKIKSGAISFVEKVGYWNWKCVLYVCSVMSVVGGSSCSPGLLSLSREISLWLTTVP